MDRELVEHYKRELSVLYESAAAFAEEYPGIADRLGGLTRERGDPMVVGLLEGTALLAARIQLKLKHEFSEFTFSLLDQLVPNYMAPTPSIMLAQMKPVYGDPDLRAGRKIAKGGILDAVYRDKDHNIACTFTLCDDVMYGPFDITKAEYLPSVALLQGLGLSTHADDAAGLRLALRLRLMPNAEDEPAETAELDDRATHVSSTSIDALTVHFVGAEAGAISLYEQFFAHLNGFHLRYLDHFGDAQVITLNRDQIEQIGFGPDDRLLPYDERLFRGFELLQDYMTFPRKFMGIRIKGLRRALAQTHGRVVDLVMTFDQSAPELGPAIDVGMFALYAVPTVNLFKKTTDRIPIKSNQHEYLVVPDRTQYLSYEPHRLIEVFLHHAGQKQKQRVQPIYRSTLEPPGASEKLFFATRRLERKRTSQERKGEGVGRYVGADLYVSISPPGGGVARDGKAEISALAYCSNRHLAELLPVGRGGTDFRLRDNTALDVVAAVPPTPPREAPIMWRHEMQQESSVGRMAWQVVNLLGLNHLGLGGK
jgi:type VI secretion system protein ImpG